MSADTDAAAIRRYPELAELVRLRDAGMQFVPIPDTDGRIAELAGFHGWPSGPVDAIRVRSPYDAVALRISRDERILWETSGTLCDVVAALLALPAPADRSAPHLSLGSGPDLWIP
ncbi:MAG: hypothetical protein JOZ47_14065 [Kutzneria sp.]|nr:hypothetical protein [Kutzneria sp.]MBV9846177.1 hypothetical protein [Kutzneria sp.]